MLRRNFIANTGSALGGSWITLSLPAILATGSTASIAAREQQAFRVLTADEATEYEAIAAHIIPSNDSPGAREAGVIYFIDTVLADIDPSIQAPLHRGLKDFREALLETHGVSLFSQLNRQQQIRALGIIENSEFFGTLRFLTLAGMFSDPSHGGNRDRVGWELIGFEGPGASQPPFGYYDADYVKKGA